MSTSVTKKSDERGARNCLQSQRPSDVGKGAKRLSEIHNFFIVFLFFFETFFIVFSYFFYRDFIASLIRFSIISVIIKNMNTQRVRARLTSRQKSIVRTGKINLSNLANIRAFHQAHAHDFEKGDRERSYQSKGFTLIEVLVVIGIIAILAMVVLVAVNPARQFKLARDSQRTSNVNAILNAIHQNMAEHKGIFTCNGNPYELATTSTVVKNGEYGADIAPCVVPDYISSLPFDPSLSGAKFNSTADYDSGYEIVRDSNGRITASSTGELTSTISVTR